MAKLFTLDEYRCVNRPKKLWRVTHGNSQSRWDQGDLIAANELRMFHNEVELKEAVENHIDWWNSRPSRFLSVFSNEDHARNWAAQREKRNPPADIHEIDTAWLPIGADILDMELLMAKLEIENPYSAHELLFLHRIPSRCFVNSRKPSGIQECTNHSGDMWWRTMMQQDERIGRTYSPKHYHLCDFNEDCYDSDDPAHRHDWGIDWDASYDSDESAEERNRNDDLLKIIEGLWE